MRNSGRDELSIGLRAGLHVLWTAGGCMDQRHQETMETYVALNIILGLQLCMVALSSSLETVKDSSDVIHTVCPGETETYACGQGEVIVMSSALYGRMASSTCIDHYPETMGCFSDVLPHVDSLCSGRPNCTLTLTDGLFGRTSCQLDYDSYLTTSHQCNKVQLAPKECDTFGKAYALSTGDHQGFLSSWVSDHTGTGADLCPWEVHTTSDKTINLTLYDFETHSVRKGDQYGGCRKYVTIEELDDDVNSAPVTVCGGSQRLRHVFMSEGRQLRVTFHKGHYPGQFLLQYKEFSILMVVIASVFLGVFALAIAGLYVKLMKEIDKKKTRAGKGGLGGAITEMMPAVSYYQQMYQESSTRKYSYIWESLDDESLNDLCLGRGKFKSNSTHDLPEVIIIVDEETKSNCQKKSAVDFVTTM